MDIARTQPPSNRRTLYIGIGVVVFLALVGVARLKPAAPAVERPTLSSIPSCRVRWCARSGLPAPWCRNRIRWISAVAPGRVEKKLVQPGAKVTPQTVLMELSNPDVEIQLLQAERQLTDAQAQLVSLAGQPRDPAAHPGRHGGATRSQYCEAQRNATAAISMVDRQLISTIEAAKARNTPPRMTKRLAIEEHRLTLITRQHSRPALGPARAGRAGSRPSSRSSARRWRR